MKRVLRVLMLVSIGAAAGCDLLSEATAFTFCTDPTDFAFDSSNLGVSASAAALPTVPCDLQQTDICAQPGGALSCSGAAGHECTVSCADQGDGSGQCEMQVAYTQTVPVDISTQVSGQTQADALSKATLSRIEYSVAQNTLNFDTPAIEVYVGPNVAAGVGASGVELLGRMEPITEQTTFAEKSLVTEQAGRDRLAELVRDYQTPFKIFAVAELRFRGGDAVPAGALQMALKACFKAEVF